MLGAQIVHFSNIDIAILDFSLFLPYSLWLIQLISKVVALNLFAYFLCSFWRMDHCFFLNYPLYSYRSSNSSYHSIRKIDSLIPPKLWRIFGAPILISPTVNNKDLYKINSMGCYKGLVMSMIYRLSKL